MGRCVAGSCGSSRGWLRDESRCGAVVRSRPQLMGKKQWKRPSLERLARGAGYEANCNAQLRVGSGNVTHASGSPATSGTPPSSRRVDRTRRRRGTRSAGW